MWFYLFTSNASYPDPLDEIGALAGLDREGVATFLKLSSRDDAPLKGAEEGEPVCLCTREDGRWLIHGRAEVVERPFRGATPPAMVPIYGATKGRWWRQLARVQLFDEPKSETDLGLAEGTLPTKGRAHVKHVTGEANGEISVDGPLGESSPLDRLTEIMDSAWERGELTPESIEATLREFRARRPYGR